ncbi:glucosyltransferase domain-containing protein [Helicobacter sp. 11S02629-2]|uniref:glucosyltransferase domain-containing protein n=1 Tax=Helicobacter sp. 11S02629-2 TaxID=1476195 RepID=UPI000BA67EA2|nr:glucosyltransferase domain-containing protein [Helicobacter sp. 11S02629-2]PAF46061.1 hypothetical protein BKH40_01240 [Helicobacter sp. 11S02629-2]
MPTFSALSRFYSSLTKGYKLAFKIWLILAILAFILCVILGALTHNKVYTASLDIKGDVKLGSSFTYAAKIDPKLSLLNSYNKLSHIKILDINYTKEVSKTDINNLTRDHQTITFKSTKPLEKGKVANLSYKISFLPLYKTLLGIFIALLILIFIVRDSFIVFKMRIYEFIKAPKFLVVFIVSFVIYLIALSALLRGDIYYINDLGRAIGQGDNWTNFSRYISSYLYALLDSFKGFPYTDISPLPQLFAALILSLSGMFISFIVRKKLDIVGIVATLPLGLSPYFLENLSYKFDAPLMSFSLLLILVPFLFEKNLKVFMGISLVFILFSLSTYQASNGIYIVFTLLLVLLNYLYKEKSSKENLKFLGSSVIAFLVAALAYKVFIITPLPPTQYVSSEAMQTTKLLEGGNLKTYLVLLLSDLKGLPFFAFSIIVGLLFLLTSTINAKRTKPLAFLASLVFLALGLCLSYGAYLVLSKPLFAPRAFIGFGVFVALVYVGLFYKQRKRILKWVNVVFVVLASYSLVVFANSYGNAITAQQNYMMMRASFVSKDLATLIPREMQPKVGVVFEGAIGYAPVASNFIKRYSGGIAKRLLPKVMNFTGFPFNNAPLIYQGTSYQDSYGVACAKENISTTKILLLDNAFHSISKANNCYFVDLKPSTWQAK